MRQTPQKADRQQTTQGQTLMLVLLQSQGYAEPMGDSIVKRAENAAWEEMEAQGVWARPGTGCIIGNVNMGAVTRAMLQAIREPTEETRDAGSGRIRVDGRDVSLALVWQAMIDAALDEP